MYICYENNEHIFVHEFSPYAFGAEVTE